MAEDGVKIVKHPDGSGDFVRVPADMDTSDMEVVEEVSAKDDEPKVVMTQKPAASEAAAAEETPESKAKASGKSVAKKSEPTE